MPKSLSSSTPLPRAGEGTRCRTLREEWGWEGAGTPSQPVPPPPGSLQHLHLPANSLQPCLCSPRPTGCPQLHPVPPKTIRTDQDPKAAPPPTPPSFARDWDASPGHLQSPPQPTERQPLTLSHIFSLQERVLLPAEVLELMVWEGGTQTETFWRKGAAESP